MELLLALVITAIFFLSVVLGSYGAYQWTRKPWPAEEKIEARIDPFSGHRPSCKCYFHM